MLPRLQANSKDQQKTNNTKGRRAEAVVTALFLKKGETNGRFIIKVLAFNDEVKAVAMVATDAIAEAQRRHDTWSSATAALGRTIIGTQLLASSLKGDERITVQVNGDGPGGKIMADANGRGECVVISRTLM